MIRAQTSDDMDEAEDSAAAPEDRLAAILSTLGLSDRV